MKPLSELLVALSEQHPKKITRRQALAGSLGAAGAAAGVAAGLGRVGLAQDAPKRVRLGVIGVGSRGTYLLRVALNAGIEVPALCDIDEAHLNGAIAVVESINDIERTLEVVIGAARGSRPSPALCGTGPGLMRQPALTVICTGREFSTDGKPFRQAMLFYSKSDAIKVTMSSSGRELERSDAPGSAVTYLAVYEITRPLAELANPVEPPARSRHLALFYPEVMLSFREYGFSEASLQQRRSSVRPTWRAVPPSSRSPTPFARATLTASSFTIGTEQLPASSWSSETLPEPIGACPLSNHGPSTDSVTPSPTSASGSAGSTTAWPWRTTAHSRAPSNWRFPIATEIRSSIWPLAARSLAQVRQLST
ncbi:MAG: hypothetical protein ABIK89_03535 [Planctomycetota bacterium]